MYKALSVLALLIMAVVVSGCTSPAEKAAETVIEHSTNGQADVDIDDNTVSVNTNAGSWQAGEEVSLPAGFPDDVHVASGTLTAAVQVNENDGYSVSINASQSAADLKTEYEAAFADDGWTSVSSFTMSGTTSISVEKDNRSATVIISEVDGQTTVQLTTSRQE